MTVKAGDKVTKPGLYRCTRCGAEFSFAVGQEVPKCPKCGNDEFILVR